MLVTSCQHREDAHADGVEHEMDVVVRGKPQRNNNVKQLYEGHFASDTSMQQEHELLVSITVLLVLE
ncbi:hypothetical protein H257_17033 [Aphanomyces astaci]|uniref:Uncharacterized protein n=1 Tax=Aphanomyces astaci TaxID=112090 RepID=W4FIE8_APHAT|nr:hypothetical protein H257_17033 [Aphanomyces astaci]ETV66604.1 hypothetical protein H257_17033 [Aphanomyces astaci]|eukprot:XP_009843975.1 hypothetical protein H257_17033 [Aphanomyces astaci]